MAEMSTILEFKLLNEQLIVTHKAFMARLRAEAPALVDDYTELAAVTRRVLMSALCLETGEAPTGLKKEAADGT